MRLDRSFSRLLLVVALLAFPHSALAAPLIVGDGTAASCTEMALKHALIVAEVQGGGTIHFECGEGPVTITVTETLTIPDDTTINGGGLITLDGGHATTVLHVDRGSTVVLRRLNIYRGNGIPSVIGGGIFNEGTLTVHASTFSGNGILSHGEGGAILNLGTLTVHDSAFFGNTAFFGGGIRNLGIATVYASTFFQNAADEGGAIYNSGTLTVHASTFSGNVAFVDNGGAILNTGFPHRSGMVTIHASTLSGNHANVSGGGIVNFGTLTINKSAIAQNTADFGGGIANGGTLDIKNSNITQNTALINGGGIFNGGTSTLKNTSVTENTPDDIFP